MKSKKKKSLTPNILFYFKSKLVIPLCNKNVKKYISVKCQLNLLKTILPLDLCFLDLYCKRQKHHYTITIHSAINLDMHSVLSITLTFFTRSLPHTMLMVRSNLFF